MTTLIFPAGMPESLNFLELARRRGEPVIGASSLAYDPVRGMYPAWVRLPYVTEPAFGDCLARLVQDKGITEVFSPHPVVRRRIDELFGQGMTGLKWASSGRAGGSLDEYKFAENYVARNPPLIRPAEGIRALSPWERAALVVAAERIPGQCARDKILLFADILPDAPMGDIVEIGSLWGRSAYALAWLGEKTGVGPLLCVDPWEAYRQDASPEMLNRTCADLDIPAAFDIFRMNLAAFRRSCHYLRAPSATAAGRYAQGPLALDEPSWGRVAYSGKISLLHVDGNHDFEAVVADLASWVPFVVPGGWIVVDDYCWPFGDGPRRAADEWLKNNLGRIEAAFVVAAALWIKLSGRRPA